MPNVFTFIKIIKAKVAVNLMQETIQIIWRLDVKFMPR